MYAFYWPSITDKDALVHTYARCTPQGMYCDNLFVILNLKGFLDSFISAR